MKIKDILSSDYRSNIYTISVCFKRQIQKAKENRNCLGSHDPEKPL